MQKIRVIDSHTAGEPTRTVVSGLPDLGSGTVAERARIFASQFADLRTGIVCEPRGYEAIVGALIVEPSDERCAAGVIYFNNVKVLGMCGHGTIGVLETMRHLGRLDLGEHLIETPAGVVKASLESPNSVSFDNVPSYRTQRSVSIYVHGVGTVTGDVAYGGNWFFLTQGVGVAVNSVNIPELLQVSKAIKNALVEKEVTGDDGAEIDHIEIFDAAGEGAHSRSFVLCPGDEFDRSPCGTGTSAKLACLFDDGDISDDETWIQESVIGTRFQGSIRLEDEKLIPTISGQAYVTADSTLILDPADPLVNGISYR